MTLPRITFGMIVLNGEPFLRYNLRALYPYAYEIIVVEGAAPAAAGIAIPDGHSLDGTMQTLLDFKAQEDAENKLIIVTAEDEGHPNGFWPGEKNEQSQAYAKRANGDWLWQVDIDEFYLPQDIAYIASTLLVRSDVSMISFKQISFWGGLDYYSDGWYLRYYLPEIRRIFRWEPGFSYMTHRPPTVVNLEGVDLSSLGYIHGYVMAKQNIYMYHYSLVFPHQVDAKSRYYSNVNWGAFNKMDDWARHDYGELRNPYRVHNVYRYPSWLENFKGNHPLQVLAMWQDIQDCEIIMPIPLRRTDDIDRLLASPRYKVGKFIVKIIGIIVCNFRKAAVRMFHLLSRSLRVRLKQALLRG